MGGILEKDFLTMLIGINHAVHSFYWLTDLVELLIGEDLQLQILLATANLWDIGFQTGKGCIQFAGGQEDQTAGQDPDNQG